jgi:RNA polymerase sigma factor (TIGR02999 family)
MSDVTRILSQIDSGDPAAAELLLPLVYDELRKLAAARLAHEKPGQTLQATALVHEAYLRLIESDDSQRWDSRRHFFAAVSEAMRRILVESARRKKAAKHGGGLERTDVEPADSIVMDEKLDLLALDEALTEFAAREPVKAQLVKLRFFAGLTMPEAADILGISVATAQRHWTFARTWLFAALASG